MAIGLHWEWRAFGAVSSRLADRFSQLERKFPLQEVEDRYLWIPDLEVNAKFRKGADAGLKFKRLRNQDGPLEQWHEDPDELFEFPLERAAWEKLAELRGGDRLLGPYPATSPDRRTALRSLEEAGCISVVVNKRREGRLWQGPAGKVKVEWACIDAPQAVVSIGLETWAEDGGAGLFDDEAKADLLAAIEDLSLKAEPLEVMNYMGAVETWAHDGSV